MLFDFSHVLGDPLTIALLILMLASMTVLCLHYGLFPFKVGRYKAAPLKKDDSEGGEDLPPVSIVMTAQNDGVWLRDNLVYLLEQDYPDFEVVVVDYLSSDDTKFVLQVLTENYKRLKVVTFREDVNLYKGKKYPMAIGIREAKNEILLLAEPDCIPADMENFCWIREMVKGYRYSHTNIVLGYCGLSCQKNLLGWIQQYDNITYSVSYLGAAMLHKPYTGCGRNLSYRRSLFMAKNGFAYHYNEPDGADDIFIHQNATPSNTCVAITPGAFTKTAAKRTYRQFVLMRKHRTATRKYYTLSERMALAIRPLSLLVFYLAFAALVALGNFPWLVLTAVVLLKFAWQIVANAQAGKKFGVKGLHWFSPLFELYFLFADTFLAIMPLSKKNR